MKFQVSDGEKFQKIMEIEIPVEELEQPIRLACKRLANKVNIPGFRKGKVPRAILENYIGIDALLQEAADLMIPQVYWDIIEEHSIEPVEQPQLELLKFENKEPVSFKAVVTIIKNKRSDTAASYISCHCTCTNQSNNTSCK